MYSSAMGQKGFSLRAISVEAGAVFIEQVTELCIEKHSEIVSIFARGILPIDMLEFATSGAKGAMLARRAGFYKNPSGSIATNDQTAAEYRKELIDATIAKDMALSNASSSVAYSGAVAILFPENEKIPREKSRSAISKSTLTILQCLTMLWPSADIQRRMNLDNDLVQAFERQDLISWVKSFNSFCLNSSGNQQINAERAERTLESTKMVGLDLPKYTNAFVKAANNVKSSGSLMSEYRIVTLFIRNLNHTEGVFANWMSDYLNKHSSTHILATNNLEFAVKYVEDYFNTVIRPEADRKKEESLNLNSVRAVENQMSRRIKGGSSADHKSVSMPFAVLATIFNTKRKQDESVEKPNPKKPKGQPKEKDKEVPSIKNAVKDDKSAKLKSKPCFKFASEGGCSFGDKCIFSHTV
jgi:hypothetical protein